ncbi:MAG: YihY/virulence factor BrkB family protein [Acidobacteriota bacterium]
MRAVRDQHERPRGNAAELAGARRLAAFAALTGRAAWDALQGFYNRDNLTYAASIAYYSLLSLFPLFLLAFVLLGHATASTDTRDRVLLFVLQYFPTQFEFITTQIDSFGASPMTTGVAGTVGLVWGALGVFSAVTTAINYAWGVQEQRSYWKQKVVAFLMLGVSGALLLVAVLLVGASHVVGSSWFAGVLTQFPGLGVLRGLTVRYATTLLFMVVVAFVYYFVPYAKVRLRDVWVGAIVTGLLWKEAFEGFSWYVRDMTRFTQVNGSIAAVVVFLLWVYVQAVILLYGAEFTAAYARLATVAPPVRPEAGTGPGESRR